MRIPSAFYCIFIFATVLTLSIYVIFRISVPGLMVTLGAPKSQVQPHILLELLYVTATKVTLKNRERFIQCGLIDKSDIKDPMYPPNPSSGYI